MPLAGGPADKAGNSYERRWTVFALIDLLEGRAQSLRIEVPGEEGIGAEFRLLVAGTPEWHQAKRQRSAGPWTINAMAGDKVLSSWWSKIGAGGRCVFVCSSSASELHELTERAGNAQSWEEFDSEFLAAEAPRNSFERLCRAWEDPPARAVYEALHQIQVRAIGESELAQWINDRLTVLTIGTPPTTVAAVLAQLVDDSLHQEVGPADVWAYLANHGIAPRNLHEDAAIILRIRAMTDSYLARLRPLYIGGEDLPRGEAAQAFDHLAAGGRVLIAGAAGFGKSVVTAQVIAEARRQRWPVLGLSADRMPDVATTQQLGGEFGLPDSPATILAGVAAGSDALLVVDQLDAVSIVSGRHPERLGVVADLLAEAVSFPGVRVLLTCRQFDIDNDRDLRAVARIEGTASVAVGNLKEEQVRHALTSAGLFDAVPPALMRLLTVPLNLALYVELAQAGVGDVREARTLTELYDRYWRLKRNACRHARGGQDEWLPVIDRLVQRMSERQELSVPAPQFDDLEQQVSTMASEGVLATDRRRIGFFHETFFDYCFARQFISAGHTLHELLASSQQDLFRRAQVRQILTYQRATDVRVYLADFEWLISSPDVRLHIKALVIALLDSLPKPTSGEWQVVRPLAVDTDSPVHNRLWQALRKNPGWFAVLDEAGEWEAWLRAPGDDVDRALWALSGAATEHGTRAAELLAQAPTEMWKAKRRGFLRIADVHSARGLFDLLAAAIDDGAYDDDHGVDLWHSMEELAAHQPGWGAELVSVLLARAIGRALEEHVNPFELSGPLEDTPQSMAGHATKAIATAAPAEFVDRLLPQLLDIVRANERPDWGDGNLIPDSIWHVRIYGADHGLREHLYESMCQALAALAAADRTEASGVFTRLKSGRHESAAFLLARGYLGDPRAFADDAADWLAGTPGALELGYSDAPSWVSRELLAAISPHCSADRFDRLVSAVLFYTSAYERTHSGLRARGHTELCLLNGLDPGRRPERADRRLAELRRKFGHGDTPPPQGIMGGAVPPPIPEDKARRMTDRQWLRAMQRYGHSHDVFWRNGRLIGDASTQAQVLEAVTKEDPQRFARLLRDLPDGTAEAYVSALLRGLAGARLDASLLTAACRHARDIGGSDANRWLVRFIESHAAGTVPGELVVMVAEIAAGDLEPGDKEAGEPWNGGDIDFAALKSTRAAAALAIGRLIAEEPARLADLQPALDRLVADPQQEVRAATAGALAPILYTNADLAMGLFTRAVADSTDALFRSGHVEHFLRHAIRCGRYTDIAPLVARMTGSADEEARRVGARQLALASFHDPELDPAVDVLLNGADEITRASAISVFADSITYVPRRDRSIFVVSAAFSDPAKTVRDEAERAFYELAEERLGDYGALLRAFADSPALADGAGAVLHSIEGSRHPLPPEALDLCEAFVSVHRQAIGDISTCAAGDATYVVRLALRLHAQHANPAIRSRCLDLIDQLVVLHAHGIEQDLDSVER